MNNQKSVNSFPNKPSTVPNIKALEKQKSWRKAKMKPPLESPLKSPLDQGGGEISENIEALKQQVEFALKNVDEGMIDSLLVGQTTIQKNKAVILSWSLEQQQQQLQENSDLVQSALPTTPTNNGDQRSPEDDGIVLYVAIKMKKKQNKEEEEDPNNNMTEKLSELSTDASKDCEEIKTDEPEVPNVNDRAKTIRSALRRRSRAKKNWLRLVTTMRNVNIADCENMFVKDEYRHIKFDEDDLDAVINGQYEVKTPPLEDEDCDDGMTPNKRVTWRESLEEAFYDTEDECEIVNLKNQRSHRASSRSPLRRQLSLENEVVGRPWSGGHSAGSGGHRAGGQYHNGHQSHSAPSSPVKSPSHEWSPSRLAAVNRRSSSASGRVRHVAVEHVRPGHSHVYSGDMDNKVRRVRCQHSSSTQEMWISGGLKSFNRRVKNRISVTSPYNSQYYSFRSQPRASRD